MIFSASHMLWVNVIRMSVTATCGNRRRRLTALGNAILDVDLLTTLEQMTGIAARWIVTVMANIFLIRIKTVPQEEGNSMCVPLQPLMNKLTVSFWHSSASPRPTFSSRALAGSFIDVLPKALNVLLREFGQFTIASSHFNLLFRLKSVRAVVGV